MKINEISISFILTLFLGDFLYSIALAQEFTDNYVLPVVLAYPSVWKPTIEVKALDQVREESLLDVAVGDEKKVLDTETSIDYFEIPKNQGNVGDVLCISPIDSEKYSYLNANK